MTVNSIETASKDTPLAPGATEVISFTITIDIPGTYTISLDGATSTLTVFLALPDSNLEAAIREIINKLEDPIYISDLEPITTLTAQEKGISDLTGLEYCVNLQLLELRDNNVSNISPLASLINLRDLGLWGNNISDISPLADLTNLEVLHLPNNNISDISPLAGLTYLSGIDLEGNNISDISPLAGLTNLHILNLIDNNITDISPLAENSGLSEGDTVDLSKNPLSTTSLNVYIPQLEARGVIVIY